MSKPRILVVDDEENLRDEVRLLLERNGFEVETACDGVQAVEMLTSRSPFDLMLLDIHMPCMNGREVLRQLPQHGIEIPVIVFTQIDDEMEAVRTLQEGANDFVLKKPFRKGELISRIELRLKDAKQTTSGNERFLSYDHLLRLDRIERRLFVHGQEKPITPRAFAILERLMLNAPETVRHRDLGAVVESNALTQRIQEIRKVTGDHAHTLIVTETGEGYRFCGEVRRR